MTLPALLSILKYVEGGWRWLYSWIPTRITLSATIYNKYIVRMVYPL